MIAERIDRAQQMPALTQKQVAEFLAEFRGWRVTSARIQQIEQVALRKIRAELGPDAGELARLLRIG